MRLESVRSVRIRSTETRNDTGSVSPPGIAFSGDAKLVFAEKIRKMYGGQDPDQLELKIEQLWQGLTPKQREKFMGNGEKENITETPDVKPKIPILERRNNCKAIAKVLDLKTDTSSSSPYADLVKNRLKAYRKEGSMISSRIKSISPPVPLTPPDFDPPSEVPCSSNSIIPSSIPSIPSITNITEITPHIKQKPPMIKREEIKPPTTVKATPTIPPPSKSAQKSRLVTRKYVVNKRSTRIVPKAPPVTLISYNEAAEQYYKALSQSFLYGPAPIDTEMLSTFANIMEGCRPIREYKFGDNL